jgi:hypothetical protein
MATPKRLHRAAGFFWKREGALIAPKSNGYSTERQLIPEHRDAAWSVSPEELIYAHESIGESQGGSFDE